MLALVMTVGCASTKITGRDSKIGTEKIAKPDRAYVYPFAATHADIPSWSTAANRLDPPSKPPTPEELEVGRKLGDLVAKELVTKIERMGLVALEGRHQSLPQPNDLMIIGYVGAVEEGNTAKRLVLGFGSGATDLTTAVEGYQMTNTGPRLLGTGQLESGGGKTPGLIVPLAVLAATATPTAEVIAEQLQIKFKEAGWIQ